MNPAEPAGAGEPRTTRILPPFYFLAALVAAIALHFAFPVMQLLTPPWTYAGGIAFVAAMVIMTLATRSFAAAETTILPFARSSELVTTGVYRVSRNPMYLSLALLLKGAALLMGSLTPFLVVPVFMLLIRRNFIRHEEAMLEERFGERYRAYRSRVRRWM